MVAGADEAGLLRDTEEATVLAPQLERAVADATVEALGVDVEQHPLGRFGIDDPHRVVETGASGHHSERSADGERNDVGDERLGGGATDLVVGNPTPQTQRAGLRVVDRLDCELSGCDPSLQMVEERSGQRRCERFRHRRTLVGRCHVGHLQETLSVAARPIRVRSQRGEHGPGLAVGVRHRAEHLRLGGRFAVGWEGDVEIDDVARQRRADELGGDPLEGTAGRAFSCLDRRRDAGSSVQEPERGTQRLGRGQSEPGGVVSRLEVEQIERGEHAETIPERDALGQTEPFA